MSVTKNNLVLLATTYLVTNNNDPVGGSRDEGNQINTDDTGKVFGTISAPADGEPDGKFIGKVHIFNNHSTDALTNAKVFMDNLLDDPGVNGVLKIETTNSEDNNTKYVKVICENTVGTPDSEIVVLPSDSPSVKYSTRQAMAGRRITCELRLVSNNTVTTAAGNIYIYDSNQTLLGMIPAGKKYASGNYDIGLAPTLNDNSVTVNRLTEPDDITFTRARNEETAISVANSGTLSAQSDQAVWIRWTAQDGRIPGQIQRNLKIKGYAE